MNVAIIDCGYVGQEVASLLAKKGFHVTATTRSLEKLPELAHVAQKTVILKGNTEQEFVPLIAHNDVIIITTSVDHPEHFETVNLHTAHVFRKLALEIDLPRNLIYVSNTSVYGDHNGQWVDETSDLLAKGDSAKNLIEAEKTYASLEEIGWDVCIFRLAEVYGLGREISRRIRSLQGTALPGNGDSYTNMIHKADCAHAIQYALRHHLTGIFNLADEDHPLRHQFYDDVSHRFGIPHVQWNPSLASLHEGNKRVSIHKIKASGYTFLHPHRVLD